MKKLLIATDSFAPRWDGITRFLLEVIPALSKRYSVIVIAPNFGHLSQGSDFELVRFELNKTKLGDIHTAKVDKKKLEEKIIQSDIVWVQSLGPIGVNSIKYARKHKKPLIGYAHSIDWELFSRSVKRFKKIVNLAGRLYVRHHYNKMDVIMVPFLEMREILKKEKINKPIKVWVSLGMDTDIFRPIADKGIAKEKVGIPSNKQVIGYVGRLGREKDLMTLLDAFKNLKKNHPDVVLLIVGDGLEEIKKEFLQTKDVYMAGSKNDVSAYLQAMDIFVMPSLTETTCLATLEAMACGLVVVVTPVGYMRSYIHDKKNGFFFPPGNSLVLKLKLENILDGTINTKQISASARRLVIDHFKWQRTIKKIESVLDQLVHIR